MRRKSRQVIELIAMFLLASMLLLPAFTFASDDASGQIEVQMINTNNPDEAVAGVKFLVYQVAAGSPYESAAITEAFADAGITVEQLTSGDSSVAQALQSFVQSANPDSIGGGTTDSSGKATVAGLEDGVYLVLQTNTDDDFEELGYRATFSPFLVYLPKMNDDGSFSRSVTCKGKCEKTELAPERTRIIVEKHWDDDNDKLGIRPTKITVGLYDPDKDDPVDVVDLTVGTSNQDQWRYEWTDLDPSVFWSVDEIDVPIGYNKTVTVEGDSALITFTITNTIQPTESGDNPVPTPTPTTTVTPTPSRTPTPTPPGGGGGNNGGGTESGGGSGRTSNVRTGDNSAIEFFTILIVMSGLVILAVSSRRKKKRS